MYSANKLPKIKRVSQSLSKASKLVKYPLTTSVPTNPTSQMQS